MTQHARNDLAALEQALASDLVYCHSTARCETRAQFLAALRDGRWQLIAWQSTRAPAPAQP
jgi:hypothetical protein